MYSELCSQINKIEGAEIIGRVEGEYKSYPFYMITRGKGEKVLLSAGLHGDEPGGVYGLLDFFQNHSSRFENRFEFTAFPCINP